MEEDNDLEKYAERLQEQIMEQLKKIYSEQTIDHWQNPRNFEKMDDPDGFARMTGVCGDSMEMYLKLKRGKVEKCTFQTDGCGTTIACGSTATELAQHKSFTEALGRVSANEILKQLDGLPEESVHCAQLAAETLRRALADYLYRQKTPWKKPYRKE
jgi:nitrogen fixation NifU-like protein